MAEGLDSDEKDRQKTESILQWVRNVEMATQQGPHVPPDRGLTSNPDLTSFARDPTSVAPSAADPDPMQALSPPLIPTSHHPVPSSTYNQSELLPHLQHNRALVSTRSASLSLSSKKPSVILSQLSQSSLRHKARGPPPRKSEKKSSPTHQHLPVGSVQSKNIENSPANQEFAAKETIQCEEKGNEPHVVDESTEHAEEKKETVLAKDDTMSGDEQRLRELRSVARTRQSSLSPLPAPTTLPSLPPTFNLPDVRALPTKHPWLKKKLPTISGVRPGNRVPPPSHTKLLSRATTSPGELNTPTQPKSAPSSPKPNRAVPVGGGGEGSSNGATSLQDNQKEEKQLNHRLGTLERRKSFSHDNVGQLQQFDQLDVGGVSPAASYGSIGDEDVPGSQQSLVAEGGSSEEVEKSTGHSSVDKVESVLSDEAAMRSNSGGLPSSQSVSPVLSDRDGSDTMNQASHHHPHSTSPLPIHQEDQKKAISSCPLSPPSLSSPRTSHSPFMRQRHISRSPSPSLTHTPPTSPLHKSWVSGSHVGTESGNVISKQKLKLLDKDQTFSFDTSEERDFTKLSKQPKFLLKKPLHSCPVSPPPSLLSPPSSQRSPSTSQYGPHHHHQNSPSDSADPHTSTKSPSPTQLSSPSLRSRSPILSEQLLLRRGSTPMSLSLMQGQQGGGPFSAKISSKLSSSRSPIHSVNPARSMIRSPPATRKFSAPKSIEESKESRFKLFEGRESTGLAQVSTSGHQSWPPDKGSVNRQDSGLGTLSTISNKFNL